MIGYCLGGTLLACTLAYLAARRERRIDAASFFAALTDFEDPGELGVFIDEEQLAAMDEMMARRGYLEGREMATTFNMLRANDLIWSFVVNNYLLGREPFPFDLLYWNSDSTRMPYAMHSFYLRKFYQENLLVEPGGITLCGVPIDLRKIRLPAYLLSTREDHIAPWATTYAATQLYRGKTRFVLAGSGHIAGVINPPSQQKYGYWTNDAAAARPGGLAGRRDRASGLLVARLGGLERRQVRAQGARARAGRRQAQADRGCARQLTRASAPNERLVGARGWPDDRRDWVAKVPAARSRRPVQTFHCQAAPSRSPLRSKATGPSTVWKRPRRSILATAAELEACRRARPPAPTPEPRHRRRGRQCGCPGRGLKPLEHRRRVGPVAHVRATAEDRAVARLAGDRPEPVHAEAVAADQLQVVAARAGGAQDRTGIRAVAADVEHIDPGLPQSRQERPRSRSRGRRRRS